MKNQDVLNWLNRRLDLTNNKQLLHFDDIDILFLRSYIYHYKKKLIDVNNIIRSIVGTDPNFIVNHIDYMINKLIADFKIKYDVESRIVQDARLNMSMGKHPFEEQTINFITKYY